MIVKKRDATPSEISQRIMMTYAGYGCCDSATKTVLHQSGALRICGFFL